MGADPTHRLLGATIRVVWTEWPRSLGLLAGGEPLGEIFRDSDRVRLEVEGREWWVASTGIRVIRAVVTDAERVPQLVYAGSLQWGAALTRRGGTLSFDVGARWARFRPLPRTVTDDEGRLVIEIVPFLEPGATLWLVRTARHPGAQLDIPPTLAMWGALVLERWRAPWRHWFTAGLSARRIEVELQALAEEMS